MKRLHLGCGRDYLQGFINVDFCSGCKADLYCDLSKIPLPFKDNEVDYVYAKHFLSYIPDVYKWLNDLHRICKDGATVRFVMPHFSSTNVWTDMGHHRGFSTSSFDCDMFRQFTNSGFRVVFQRLTFPTQRFFMRYLANRFKGFYDHNLAYTFPANELIVELKVYKQQEKV